MTRALERGSGPRSERSERGGPAGAASDPEIPLVVRKRQFSNAYRLRILREADQCRHGELGALLRREGLYHATIIKWRSWREKMNDLTPEASHPSAKTTGLEKQNKRLQAEVARLNLKVQRMEGLLDLQKKAFELLDVMNQEKPGERNN
jgi:transposase